MPVILPVEGKIPKMGQNCFIAPNATIVGDVIMGDDCSIWFNAVVRGDVNFIRMGDEYWRNAFRPLLPGISHEVYNSMEALNAITEQTACVIMEPVQAEAGIIVPDASWLEEIRAKCNKTGCLLIFDEIQTGFGRTGSMFAFQRFDIIPDILLLGKALGGGMPLGAFISSRKNMLSLTSDPVLGHITTFGGHPVSCAAGRASMEVLLTEKLMGEVEEKGRYFQSLLHHPEIKSIRRIGLWMAVELQDFKTNKKIIDNCIANGLLTDWFLFADNCLRISPPLTIENSDIENASSIILSALDKKNNI